MEDNLFDINNFNIIQDEENYYFFRALNMADNADIEQHTTISTNGKLERIRTDRERYDGEPKYTEDSEISLEVIRLEFGNTSLSLSFLKQIKPEISVIMVGVDNDYGHPKKEILNRLKNLKTQIYRTD